MIKDWRFARIRLLQGVSSGIFVGDPGNRTDEGCPNRVAICLEMSPCGATGVHPRWCDLRLVKGWKMDHTPDIEENYGRFTGDDRSWDVSFWQRRESGEIFDAVWGMMTSNGISSYLGQTDREVDVEVERGLKLLGRTKSSGLVQRARQAFDPMEGLPDDLEESIEEVLYDDLDRFEAEILGAFLITIHHVATKREV